MARKGRGQLSSLELLPEQAGPIVAWASQALADRSETQTDLYAEFVRRLEELQAEHRGELAFDIPSFSSFHRHAMRQAALTSRMNETRAIVAALADNFSAKESDDLTIIAGEAIKSLVFHIVADADASNTTAKDAMQMASALRQAAQGQHISATRRRQVEAEFAEKVDAVIETAVEEKGMSAERAKFLREEVLGVRT